MVRLLTIAQLNLPVTRDPHPLYTLCLVAPVARNPTAKIMSPKAPIQAPISTKVIFTASTLWNKPRMKLAEPKFHLPEELHAEDFAEH